MKTLLISEIFPPRTGGSGRWFWEIYRRLSRQTYVIGAGEDPRQADFDPAHDLVVRRLPLTMSQWGLRSRIGLAGYWRALRAIRKVVRDEGIRRVHCGRCLPEGVMALVMKLVFRIPYLCYVHGEDVNTARESRELSWLVHRVLHQARFVIANSRNTAELLRGDWRLPADRVRLLYPGVDIHRFIPAARDPAARESLGWGERRVIVTVGRLQKRKGHDQMIRALPAIREQIPDVLYCIVGTGEETDYLKSLVAELKLAEHVQFRGETTDAELIHCYQQCDLFALPNRQVGQDIEGFGMVLLEAQACGRPVLAGASGGTAETMRVPETGRIVNCDSPEPLAQTVVELLSDAALRERMGIAGREWVAENFAWDALAQQAELLFDEGTPN